MTDEAAPARCGFVALLGAPNAGKSTLLNRFVGAKVSIVTPKVQTTRSRILGIALRDVAQIIFIDTPGIFQPKKRFDRAMVRAAWSGARDADLIVVLIDATEGVTANARRIIDGLSERKRKAICAINKIDAVERPALLTLAETLDRAGPFSDIFMISALTGDGVGDLGTVLAERIPLGRWLYPEDQIADMPLRLLAAEITREKLFLQLQQELPYAAAVETEAWTERDDGSVRIDQIIYVRRTSQKKIVLGKAGARVKSIGSAARKELEGMFDRRVHLFIHVKVRERWIDDPERYRELGLDYNA